MNDEHPDAEGRTRWPVVLLTVIGVALIASAIFLARTLDDTYGIFFAADQIGFQVSKVAHVALVKRAAFLFLLPVFGLLCDLTSRRGWLMGGAFVFGMGVMAKAAASKMPLYFVGEIGAAIGLAMALPALFALALEACWTHRVLASVAGGVLLIEAFMNNLTSSLSFKIAEASSWRWTYGLASGGVLLGAVVGGSLLLVSALMARRRFWPENRIEAPRGRWAPIVVLGLLAVALLICSVNSSAWSTIVYFMRYVLGLASASTATVFLGYRLGWIAAIIVAAPLADILEWLLGRRTRRSLARPAFVVAGIVVVCAGSALLRIADGSTGAAMAMTALGVGSGLATPSLIALLASNIKHRWWATAVSVYQVVCALGYAAASAGAGGMLNRFGYVPNLAQQSAETIAGFRIIFSITIVIGALALAFAVMAAVAQMTGRSPKDT
jgi:MFS family permease